MIKIPLNKQAGNMYPWITHTWNPIKGKCPHGCVYCYMKRFKVGELRLVEKELKIDLGENNIIFVGSSTDMFADGVPKEWILKVLEYCNKFNNTYLFQTKNPKRFLDFYKEFPKKIILGTTIETDRHFVGTEYENKAPITLIRASLMESISKDYTTMVSIEPIMDIADLDYFIEWIKDINPKFVSIGADSKGSKLPEPSKEDIEKLIKELKEITEVKVKDNLKRLME